jgi:hypothetical protein
VADSCRPESADQLANWSADWVRRKSAKVADISRPFGRPAMADFGRLFKYDIHRYCSTLEKSASTSTFSILNRASFMSSNGFFSRTQGVDQIIMEMMDSDEADLLSGLICNKPTCSNCIYDSCDVCKSDFCQECIDHHDCGQSSSSVPKSSAHEERQVDQLHVTQDSTLSSSTATVTMASTRATATSNLAPFKSANLSIAANKGNYKRRFFEKKVFEKESLKNLYDGGSVRYEVKDIKFAGAVKIANSSWVWKHFAKFDHEKHPDFKETACCIPCFEAAKTNPDISFTVLYTVCFKDTSFMLSYYWS